MCSPPLPPSVSDMNNNRYQCLRFTVGCNSVLHGFAGYFETTLYKDVTLSKSADPFVLWPILFFIHQVFFTSSPVLESVIVLAIWAGW